MSTSINAICIEGYRHARAVGFNLADHIAQLLMIADEVAEAAAHIDTRDEEGTSLWGDFRRFNALFLRIGTLRRAKTYTKTPSRIANDTALVEELADIVIRVCTYAQANAMDLDEAIRAKLAANQKRIEERHGKAF